MSGLGGFYMFLVVCSIPLPIVIFYLTLRIAQLLSIGGGQGKPYQTRMATLPTKRQVKIALVAALIGAIPLVILTAPFITYWLGNGQPIWWRIFGDK